MFWLETYVYVGTHLYCSMFFATVFCGRIDVVNLSFRSECTSGSTIHYLIHKQIHLYDAYLHSQMDFIIPFGRKDTCAFDWIWMFQFDNIDYYESGVIRQLLTVGRWENDISMKMSILQFSALFSTVNLNLSFIDLRLNRTWIKITAHYPLLRSCEWKDGI